MAFGSGDPSTDVQEHRKESKEGISKIEEKESDGVYRGKRVARVICRSNEHQCGERERKRKREWRGTKQQLYYIVGGACDKMECHPNPKKKKENVKKA